MLIVSLISRGSDDTYKSIIVTLSDLQGDNCPPSSLLGTALTDCNKYFKQLINLFAHCQIKYQEAIAYCT